MRALALIVLVLALTACGIHNIRPHGRVKVAHGPPARPHVDAARPHRPSPRHVWVTGHNVHRSGRYTWVKARWAVPPRGTHAWVPGQHSRGEWSPGHWR